MRRNENFIISCTRVHVIFILWYVIHVNTWYQYLARDLDLGLSTEFFKYGAVMPPKLRDVSKMTVEWLDIIDVICKEASLSFYHVCCSTFQLFFSKKNIFSSYRVLQYNHDFFFGNLRRNPLSKILTQIDLPANYCSDKASKIVHTMKIGATDARAALTSFKLLFEAWNM